MLGHLRRRCASVYRKGEAPLRTRTLRFSTNPICPAGGDGTGRSLRHSSFPMAKHGVGCRFAISTRRARHKHHRINARKH